ncbi:putative transcriptional regulator [Listeria floridensis FSL S10-1187]|uniref:Transcriptional regulator n=1 Tax=Listeria floridensis FSL S10-1187 TaxID=1265817 RepID=A0ABP3AWX2_9LIST|nr:GntR family transcriptional regulator [Listeria floridensis]EUJ30319.1 putative transcriptional regulator [Listeria floridensis FSL S10-1187]
MENKRRETMETMCYRELKERIHSGFYQPGERLIEAKISKEMDISRTPVRKAISMLAADGFVQNTEYRGAVVNDSSLGKERYIEMLDMLGLFMKHAIRRIEAKRLPLNYKKFDEMRSELSWRIEAGQEKAYLNYGKSIVLEFIFYLKNNCYTEITEDFFKKIDQFGNLEVLTIIESSGPVMVDNFTKLLEAIRRENYLGALAAVDKITERQILLAYR